MPVLHIVASLSNAGDPWPSLSENLVLVSERLYRYRAFIRSNCDSCINAYSDPNKVVNSLVQRLL